MTMIAGGTTERTIALGIALMVLCLGVVCEASPKYDDAQKTYPHNQWRRAAYKENGTNYEESSVTDRTERLGFSTGYGSGSAQGYPYSGSGVGSYSPYRLDLGGLLFGAIIGVGALLIVPKLVGVFGGNYGGSGNYRSAIETESTGLAEMLSKLDEILGANNIDSTACVQRAVCSYVRASEANMKTGSADQTDQIIHTISGNPLVDYMLKGTAVKEALENGRNVKGRDCDTLYPACPMDRNTINGVLNKFLPTAAGAGN